MSLPAPLHLRIAAAIYDVFPLIALWMLTAALFLLAAHGRVDAAHPPLAYRVALQVTLFAVSAEYFIVSWACAGQTIGMRAWRIRVVGNTTDALSLPRASLRFVVAMLSLLALGLGFLWCLTRADRRGWHDLAAATQVLKLPPR